MTPKEWKLEPEVRRFLNYILTHGSKWSFSSDARENPNWDAIKIFVAVERAFDRNRGEESDERVEIGSDLLHRLASCARIGAAYTGRMERFPWDKETHCEVIIELVDYLYDEVVEAIEKGKVLKKGRSYYFGRMRIPRWLVEAHAPLK